MEVLRPLPKQSVLIDVLLSVKVFNKVQALIKDFALVLSFTLITAISAKLKLEIGPVPITGQTFAVLLAGALLGSKRGALSQIFYLLGGLAGIPWFVRGGGLAYLSSPTFGYILGFVFAAYFVGLLCEVGFDRKIETTILAMIIGNIVIYSFGLAWLARSLPIEKSLLAAGLYPFIPGDIIKILLASLILPFGWKALQRSTVSSK
jgi:biotin transporter BioY